MAYEQFTYGGIRWVNYRGTDDGSKVAVNTDEAKFYPVDAPGAFLMAYSPGEFFDTINLPGQDVYSLVIPDQKRNAFVTLRFTAIRCRSLPDPRCSSAPSAPKPCTGLFGAPTTQGDKV